jgi:hypothetical protein
LQASDTPTGKIKHESIIVTSVLTGKNHNFSTSRIPLDGTYQDINNTIKNDSRSELADDIVVTVLLQGLRTNPEEKINWNDVKQKNPIFLSTRKLNVTPQGSFNPMPSSIELNIKPHEYVKSIRKTIKSFIKETSPMAKYFVVELSKNNHVLEDTDKMPSFSEPFNSNEYGVTIDRLQRIQDTSSSSTSTTLLGDLKRFSISHDE